MCVSVHVKVRAQFVLVSSPLLPCEPQGLDPDFRLHKKYLFPLSQLAGPLTLKQNQNK